MTRIHTDFSRVPISVAPSPATSGTSLGVTDANAAKLPDVYPYWAVLVPTGQAPTRTNAEIVKVTGGSSSGGTTTLTIIRAQGVPVTTAQSITTSFDIYDANSVEAILGVNVSVKNETPGGSINSSNKAFTTAAIFASGLLEVYHNGVRLDKDVDYTEDADLQGFTLAAGYEAPLTGDTLVVDYLTTSTSLIQGSNSIITNETPSGTIDGSNATLTLAYTPVANTLMLYRDGQLMVEGTGNDFTISGGTITLTTPANWATGTVVKATYQKTLTVAGNADTVDGYNASKTPVESEIPVLSNTANWLRDSIYRQAIINGGCQVAQMAAVNLTNGKLYGAVDMFYAKGAGTAVSAGTISQATNSNASNSGLALRLAGVTLTGTGIVYAYTFIEAKNALLYKNKTASFGVVVYHDVGSAKNFTIKINKANAADNFSAVTNIATDTAQSVENATATRLLLENVSLGDCSNGIEIEVYCESGAITTKNFDFSEWQFNEGAVLLPFAQVNYNQDLLDCMRFYQRINATANYSRYAFGTCVTTGRVDAEVTLKTQMRALPTLSYSDLGHFQGSDGVNATTGITAIAMNTNTYSKDKAHIYFEKTGSFTVYRPYYLESQNTTSGWIAFSARPTLV